MTSAGSPAMMSVPPSPATSPNPITSPTAPLVRTESYVSRIARTSI